VAGVRLSDIADDVHLEASVLIPLARRLVSAGAIRILESNAFGDLVVTLTSDGRHLLDPEASGELIRRIMAS
jgi:hypothetical protein